MSAEILALAAEQAFGSLRCPPARVALPDVPTPTSHAMAQHYYPRATDLCVAAARMLGLAPRAWEAPLASTQLDVPDKTFTGPF